MACTLPPRDFTQPKCIAGEHYTGAIFCNTDKTFFPIVFDHRTVSLQSAETGCCRWLLDVLWEYIVCTLCIFGSFPSPFTNTKRSNQGGKRPGGETGSPLLGQCVMRTRTGTSAPSALPVQIMAAKNVLSTNRKWHFLSLFLSYQ